MNFARVKAIADAVLYEGYCLWPYTPSSLKNQRRWTFGGLSPHGFDQSRGGSGPQSLRCAFLIRGEPSSEIEFAIRYLQPVERKNRRANFAESGFEQAAPYLAYDEAIERTVQIGPLWLGELSESRTQSFGDPGGELNADGQSRTRRVPISGQATLESEHVQDDIYRLSVRVENTTEAVSDMRHAALATLDACHVIVQLHGAAAFSTIDPPDSLKDAVQDCGNERTWPILVGPEGETDMVLCSPIILSDYASIAPESPGDLFDATENDELLTLSILTLSDDERRTIAQSDRRVAALLERAEALNAPSMARLHGTLRNLKPSDESASRRRVRSNGSRFEAGSRVVLKPKRRADIMDIALAGKVATVVTVECDLAGREYVTVAVDDDPGRDLATAQVAGHRFFFSIEEVELLGADA